MALMHYADLKAQGYKAGKLALVTVACGLDHKGKELITSNRAQVTCPACVAIVKTFPPEEPRQIQTVRLMPGRPAEEVAAPAVASVQPGIPATLRDGAPVTLTAQPPTPRAPTPATQPDPGVVTFGAQG